MNENRSDYISLFDLLEWAKQFNNYDLVRANNDLLNLLNESKLDLPTYTIYQGIKPRITKNNYSLSECLKSIERNNGYFPDVPF